MKNLYSFFFYSMLMCIAISCLNNSSRKYKSNNPVIDSVYNSWKKAEPGNFTFQYPPEWSFKQKDFGSGKQYGVNPPGFEDLESYFVFEIIEFPTGGQPFKEFEIAAFNSYYKRTNDYVEVISKEHIKFDNLDTYLVQLTMYNKKSELIDYISMYIINGINKYYSISVHRDLATSKIKLNGVLNLILKSVKISR